MFKLKNYEMNENCKLVSHTEKNADGFTWIIFKLHEDTLTNKITVCRNEERVPLNDALKNVYKKKSKKPSKKPNKKYKPFELVDKNIKSLEAGVYCFNSRTFNDMFPNRCNTPSFKLLIEGSNYEYSLEQINCGKTNNKSATTGTKKSQVNSNTLQPNNIGHETNEEEDIDNNNHSNQQPQLNVSMPAIFRFCNQEQIQKFIEYAIETRTEWRIEPTIIYFNNDYFSRIVNENMEINDDIENYYRDKKSNEYSIPFLFKTSFCEQWSVRVEETNLNCYQDSTLLETNDLIKVMITLDKSTIKHQSLGPYFVGSIQIIYELHIPPDTNIYLLLQLLQKFIKSFNINDYYVYKIINEPTLYDSLRNIIPIYKTSTKLKQLIKNNQIYFKLKDDNNTLNLALLPFHLFCFWRPEDKYDEIFHFGMCANLYLKTRFYSDKIFWVRIQNDKHEIELSLRNLQQYKGIVELYEIFKNNTPTTTKFYSSLKCTITYGHFQFNFLLYVKPTDIRYIPNDYVDEREFNQMINIKPENTNSLNCLYHISQKDRETHFDDSVDELCQAVKNLNLENVEIKINKFACCLDDYPPEERKFYRRALVFNKNLIKLNVPFSKFGEPLDFLSAHFDEDGSYRFNGHQTSIAELIFKLCKYIVKHFKQNQNIYLQKYGEKVILPICDETLTFIFGDTTLSMPRDDKYLSAISKKRGNIELNYQREVNLKKSKLLCILNNNQIASTNNSNNNIIDITEEQSNEPLVTITLTHSQLENLLNLSSNNSQQYNNRIQFVSNQVGNSSQIPQNDFTVYNQSVNRINFNGIDNTNNAHQSLPNSYSQNQQMLGNNNGPPTIAMNMPQIGLGITPPPVINNLNDYNNAGMILNYQVNSNNHMNYNNLNSNNMQYLQLLNNYCSNYNNVGIGCTYMYNMQPQQQMGLGQAQQSFYNYDVNNSNVNDNLLQQNESMNDIDTNCINNLNHCYSNNTSLQQEDENNSLIVGVAIDQNTEANFAFLMEDFQDDGLNIDEFDDN
ncbi:hypothetical protein ABK040_010928 [Willaertia magna]